MIHFIDMFSCTVVDVTNVFVVDDYRTTDCIVLFFCLIAAFITLRSIVLCDLLGVEKLTNAFGLVALCQGVAITVGTPILGSCQFNEFVVSVRLNYRILNYQNGPLSFRRR